MGKDPAVLFYTSDFLSGTAFFTKQQRGEYITLLCEQHQLWSIPEDHLLEVCGSLDSPVAKKFVKDSDGSYYNERMREETVKRRSFCESRRKSVSNRYVRSTHVPTHVEHTYLRMENENENEDEDINELWKKKLDVYLEIENVAFVQLINDEQWINERQKYHPNLDIKLSLEKAHKEFWGTEAGWKHKKKQRAKEIDFRRTFLNALDQRSNQVWKSNNRFGRQEVSIDSLKAQAQRLMETLN